MMNGPAVLPHALLVVNRLFPARKADDGGDGQPHGRPQNEHGERRRNVDDALYLRFPRRHVVRKQDHERHAENLVRLEVAAYHVHERGHHVDDKPQVAAVN